MKIEKVNENQIRCTLTREDLASRELKISELAYGTEKAKNLFRDMMQQANFEFGFEAEDIPLMIEAIPLNSECIVLIITKVEDPEELDTRFARFAPSVTEDMDDDMDDDEREEEIADLFRRLQGVNKQADSDAAPASDTKAENGCVRIFRMKTLQQVLNAAAMTANYYSGQSALYKEERTSEYLLVLTLEGDDRDNFDRICFCLSEYGTVQRTMPAGITFLEEHCEALVKENALQALSFGSNRA